MKPAGRGARLPSIPEAAAVANAAGPGTAAAARQGRGQGKAGQGGKTALKGKGKAAVARKGKQQATQSDADGNADALAAIEAAEQVHVVKTVSLVCTHLAHANICTSLHMHVMIFALRCVHA